MERCCSGEVSDRLGDRCELLDRTLSANLASALVVSSTTNSSTHVRRFDSFLGQFSMSWALKYEVKYDSCTLSNLLHLIYASFRHGIEVCDPSQCFAQGGSILIDASDRRPIPLSRMAPSVPLGTWQASIYII
jgi:hypothetical protein